MNSLRSPDLQFFLTSAEAVIRNGSSGDGRVHAAAGRIFTALQTPYIQGKPRQTRLPVCRYLPTALEHTASPPDPVGTLAKAFAAIEPQLNWKARVCGNSMDEQFQNGHANAIIAGPEGLEIRSDARIGVSLMAPHTRYPDHRHPPEEIYVVLSEGHSASVMGVRSTGLRPMAKRSICPERSASSRNEPARQR